MEIELKSTIGYSSFIETYGNLSNKSRTNLLSLNDVNLLYLILFRILIFLDQCHDFAENEDRNTFFKDKSETVLEIKTKVIKNLIELLDRDFNYIFYNINQVLDKDEFIVKLNLETYKNFIIHYCNSKILNKDPKDKDVKEWISIMEYFSSTNNLFLNIFLNRIKDKSSYSEEKYKITELILNCFFGIQRENIVDLIKKIRGLDQFDCTLNWKELPYLVSLNKKLKRGDENTNKIDVFVDADKSRYNIIPISSYACSTDRFNTPMKYIDTIATEFDGASTPVSKNLINILGKEETENLIDKEQSDRLNKNLSITVTFDGIKFIRYNYINSNIKDLDDINNITSLRETYTKIKNKIITDDKITQQSLKTLLNDEYDLKYNNNLLYLSDKPKIIKLLENYEYKYPSFSDDIISSRNVVKLDMEFFSYKSPDEIINMSYKLRSVRNITSIILEENKPLNIYKGKYIKYFPPIKNYDHDPFNLVYFKTAGDLGQILLSHSYEKSQNNAMIYFLTFDRICSFISSLFNYGTIFESGSDPLFPLDIFNYYNYINLEEILSYLYSGGPYKLDDPFSRPPKKRKTQFGKSKDKKQKSKGKNTSKKLEKLKKEALKMGLSKSSLKQGMAKLQKNITKLKSLAKKYRLKINKKLITNIKKCIKIHDKAKKLKIKLTKTTKSGKRLYKTPSELLKEIKSKMKQK